MLPKEKLGRTVINHPMMTMTIITGVLLGAAAVVQGLPLRLTGLSSSQSGYTGYTLRNPAIVTCLIYQDCVFIDTCFLVIRRTVVSRIYSRVQDLSIQKKLTQARQL